MLIKYIKSYLFLIITIVAFFIIGEYISKYELSLISILRSYKNIWFITFMDQSCFSGKGFGGSDIGVFFQIIVVIMYFFAQKPTSLFFSIRIKLGWMLATSAFYISFVHALKNLVGRARPCQVSIDLPYTSWLELGSQTIYGAKHVNGSMPSGHVASIAFFFVLVFLIPKNRYFARIGTFLAVLFFAVLMGLTRCSVMMHWLTDSWVSIGLAFGISYFCYLYIPKICQKPFAEIKLIFWTNIIIWLLVVGGMYVRYPKN